MSRINFFADINILLYLLAGDNTVSDLLNKKRIFTSFITEIELLTFQKHSSAEKNIIRKLLSECTVISFNSEIKGHAIDLRLKYNLKVPDAIIAGTAIHLRIPLVTADKHFKNISETDIIFYQNL